MKEIVIDIETLSTRADAAILSIGAVEIDRSEFLVKEGSAFYRKIDIQSSLDLGLTFDDETVTWWTKQIATSRAEALGPLCDHSPDDLWDVLCSSGISYIGIPTSPDRLHLNEVVGALVKWIGQDPETVIWANSPSFDCVILESSIDQCLQHDAPWKFWNERDLRTHRHTLERLGHRWEHIAPDFKHHALHDALAEARSIIANDIILDGKIIGHQP